MSRLRRVVLLVALALLAGIVIPAAQPSPPQAKANALCDVGTAATAPIGAIAGAVGIGNPVSDVCSAVTDPILGVAGKALDPLREAAAGIGKGIFNQITAWVADGAVWLLGEIAEAADKTTSPNLLSRGFLHQYRLMVGIAAAMAALMLIFAVFEALGRGDAGMLWRVFLVNVPLAAIATTVAYVVVQLLLATGDGMCEAITQSTGKDAHKFLKGAVEALISVGGGYGAAAGTAAGGAAGAAGGAVAVPLFIGFIAAVVTAFAAFFVWIELLMRDAAVYVVALFMPLAIAASSGRAGPQRCEDLRAADRRLFSKFVIVAIISLAASLLAHNEGSVEQVLAAAAMLLLACFAPFVLFKLVPFAETAVAAAYSRQSAAGGAVRGVELANSVMMVQRLSRANWAAGGGGGGGRPGSGGGEGGGKPSKGPSGGGGGATKGGEAAPVAEAAAAGPAAVGARPRRRRGRNGEGGECRRRAAGGERRGAGCRGRRRAGERGREPGDGWRRRRSGGTAAGGRGRRGSARRPQAGEAGGGQAPSSGSPPASVPDKGGNGQTQKQPPPAAEPSEASGGGAGAGGIASAAPERWAGIG